VRLAIMITPFVVTLVCSIVTSLLNEPKSG